MTAKTGSKANKKTQYLYLKRLCTGFNRLPQYRAGASQHHES